MGATRTAAVATDVDLGNYLVVRHRGRRCLLVAVNHSAEVLQLAAEFARRNPGWTHRLIHTKSPYLDPVMAGLSSLAEADIAAEKCAADSRSIGARMASSVIVSQRRLQGAASTAQNTLREGA